MSDSSGSPRASYKKHDYGDDFSEKLAAPEPAHLLEDAVLDIPADPEISRLSTYGKAVREYFETAQKKTKRNNRPLWAQILFEYTFYTSIGCVIYFGSVGWPLWNGAIYSFWIVYHEELDLEAGMAIFIGLAFFFSAVPLLSRLEPTPVVDEEFASSNKDNARETCLIIPCYKSAAAIGATLEAALKIFPPGNIFVVDNGNNPTPFDHTASICESYGVRYFWVNMGSKIIAQFIGCQAAQVFRYALLIDDDCTLPDNFPLRTERIQLGPETGLVKCLGYTISSVGSGGYPGTLTQQAQDLEYKSAGNSRYFWGKLGSATFPHGAIALWDREFLAECFKRHPGFTISEDWFFGHVSRRLGGRIQMCSEIFVKTETPPALIRASRQGSRAGYGEMTVAKQRIKRWNFFLVSRIWHDANYILFSWNLGIYELSTKLCAFQEVYESFLFLAFPIVTPIALSTYPGFTLLVTFCVLVLYLGITVTFNEIHLRRKGIMVSRKAAYLYYPPYKVFLRLMDVWSVYRSIWMYARYFRTKHPSIYENEKAMQNLIYLAESQDFLTSSSLEIS